MTYLFLDNTSSDQRRILFLAMSVLLLSCISFYFNSFYFHYVGNNYFPPEMPQAIFGTLLLLAGFYFLYGSKHRAFKTVRELLFFFIILSLLALLTNATQYTPFNPVDPAILSFENHLGVHLTDYMAWAYQYPWFVELLIVSYNSLNVQVAFLPLTLIVLNQTHALRRFYFLLLFCALTGFTFYYFFPTTAPASVLHSPYFMTIQKMTSQKFYQVHHAIPSDTLEGGMIALPSFHVIWAWLCVDLVKNIRCLLIPLIPLNILLTLACVLLGWHYPTDLIGSFIVIALGFGYYKLGSVYETNYLHDF